jgi:MYXO-CTERM domain-containing protein
VVLLATLLPSTAFAQTWADAGSDLDAAQAELGRAYEQALASDCALACRALESLRHATERLCALDPGDRCTNARRKLEAATTRVRSACPVCAQQLDEQKSAVPAPPPPASESVVEAESVQRKGGCAGCTTAPTSGDALGPLALAALAVLALRRRRR